MAKTAPRHLFLQLSDSIVNARWLALALPALATAAAIGLWILLPSQDVERILSEHGPVENLTERLFLMAALLAGLLGWWRWSDGHRDHTRMQIALSVMLLAFALREMHMHQFFPESNMLTMSFYLGDMHPAAKATGLIALALCTAAVLYIASGVGPRLLAPRGSLDAGSISLIAFLTVLILTKMIDKAPAIMSDHGLQLSASTITLLRGLEEIGELSLPLIAMLGLYQGSRRFMRRSSSSKRRFSVRASESPGAVAATAP